MTGQRVLVITGILIPVLVVLFIVGVIVIPRFTTKPTINFVYATGLNDGAPYRDLPAGIQSAVRTREYYFVRDGRLVREVQNIPVTRPDYVPPVPDRSEVRLYLHDVRANRSRPLTLDEASHLRLDDSKASPDGFQLEYTYGDSGGAIIFPLIFLDGGSGKGEWALTGHGARHRVALKDPSGNRYDQRVVFLGWVIGPS